MRPGTVNRSAGLSSVGNSVGVRIRGANNIIGGTVPGATNVISGNTSHGAYFDTLGGIDNTVQGNFIGVDATGTGALGNGADGIRVASTVTGNLIGGTIAGAGNVIAHNIGGIVLEATVGGGNTILQNIIHDNANRGIDLASDGVTVNDASDVEPFTAGEVEAVQAATTLKSPAGGGELRVDLVDKHGDEWP